MEERRKDFVGCVLLGIQRAIWLVDTVEEALKSPGEDFAKSFREAEKMILVRGGENKAGRFFEGNNFCRGWSERFFMASRRWWWMGWRRLAGELRKTLVVLEAKVWPLVSEVLFSEGK